MTQIKNINIKPSTFHTLTVLKGKHYNLRYVGIQILSPVSHYLNVHIYL